MHLGNVLNLLRRNPSGLAVGPPVGVGVVKDVSSPGCATAGGTKGFAVDAASLQLRRSRMSMMVCLQSVQDVQVIRVALG